MGAESYYIYVDVDNADVDPDNLQSFNGKRVGVNKGSLQQGMLEDWARKNDLNVEIVEITDDEAYFMTLLTNGEIDALVTMDSYGAQERVIPVCKIGASDYYFAVNKARPGLLNELNNALSVVQEEDPYFNQRMFDNYVKLTRTNAYLSPTMENWLTARGTIRVGYLDDYLPFCAANK